MEDLKFEEALKRLEKIVGTLESGVDELDQIVDLFQEGSDIVKICNSKLTEVEAKIEIITQKLNKNDSDKEEE